MKKRIKKLLSITLSACMILPVFSVSVVEAKPEKTIRVWYWEDNDGSYADAYDTWSEQYPDVNLELEAIPWNSYHDTLIAAAASGDLPDVYKIQPTWIPELRSLNAVAKLDEYIDSWEDKDTIPESMWESARAGQEETYAWPHSLVVLYLYCRKSYFEDAGLEYPKTMDEFYQACEALTKDTDGDGSMYIQDLVIGGECGGSDFTSGLAGNALIGSVFDYVADHGGTAVFEELSEGIGLKDYLVSRGIDDKVKQDIANAYDKTVDFCSAYGQFSIAPGNMDGGLTTIEEKSMGAMVKSGRRPIQSVLKIAQSPTRKGVHLLDVIPDEKLEPAHFIAADPSDMLDLIAAGCHIVFLVTGRGHVVGTPVSPVVKVTGNPRTYNRMQDDIDFCAAGLLDGTESMSDMTERMLKKLRSICCGRLTNAEKMGHREGILYFNYQDPVNVPKCWQF